LYDAYDFAPQILHHVRDVTDSVAVGKKVPTTGAIAVVVEPGAEDEVRGGSEEEAIVSG
jgi:hypothetical protein